MDLVGKIAALTVAAFPESPVALGQEGSERLRIRRRCPPVLPVLSAGRVRGGVKFLRTSAESARKRWCTGSPGRLS